MAWATPPTFTAGAAATASDMNTLGADMLLVGKPPLAYVINGSSQSIASGTDTAITWSAPTGAINAPDTMWASGNSSRLTIVTAGTYMFSSNIVYTEPATVNAGTYRQAYLRKSGTTQIGGSTVFTSAAATGIQGQQMQLVIPPILVSCTAGDYFEIMFKHGNTGGAIATFVNSTIASSFTAQWVSA